MSSNEGGVIVVVALVVVAVKIGIVIIGRRRNMDVTLGDSQEWFPIWAWVKYEKKQLNDLVIVCGIEEKDQEVVKRMVKVALCCVQYRPEIRPVMSIVVKMLEGALEVPEPSNPFLPLFSGANEADLKGWAEKQISLMGCSETTTTQIRVSDGCDVLIQK
ncbi:hypothetical protein L1987_21156 [Smallanthus sonchifolius]|uniref:Uncharacterized protein n=1 Tax=Smallanthus sonchifolius TaxID=185202 RepID=A0ACB9ITK3_9ASTR|nr:hypothetical protein L1987_21156 [Smallanthus sonchifolius]